MSRCKIYQWLAPFFILSIFCLNAFDDAPVAWRGRFIPYSVFAKEQKFQDTKPSMIEHSNDLAMLPLKNRPGTWAPLKLLEEKENNFTAYSPESFRTIRVAYINSLEAYKKGEEKLIAESNIVLGNALKSAYREIAGKTYLQTASGSLYYPTLLQLKMEQALQQFPWTVLLIALYTLTAALLVLNRKILGTTTLLLTFTLHTALLLARTYILGRPPVSNMYETVIYVPWVTVLLSFLFISSRTSLVAGAVTAASLLAILLASGIDGALTTVQAVLNSQYWLTIHVLMVVGSYGAFALAGVMGHFALIRPSRRTSKNILLTLYTGTALLITGTILGGVWAAQSWGRFWDWDPKESWAFISSCTYLLIIHAYRFNKIADRGLAIGSIIGLLSITFTWYGVNYILGTGLHSYGFGSGGEIYYYSYVVGEILFIGYSLKKEIRAIV